MSKTIYDVTRTISKCTASVLVMSCVLLSSPGILLADDATASASSSDVSSQSQTSSTDSSTLDVQPVQPAGSAVDATTVAPDTTAVTTSSPDTSAPATASDSSLTDTTSPTTSDPSQTSSPADSATTTSSNDPSSSNTDTGSNSQNASTTNTTNSTDVTNQNYAQVFNDSFLQADTGLNTADYNTGSGIITTNTAEGDGQLLNVINENITQTGDGGTQSPDSSNNSVTGSGSSDTSQTNINNDLTVKNVNDANVINRVTANVNSGNNDASFNTGHGIITSGNANLGLNFFSLENANLFGSNKFYANLQNIYNDYTGNVDLSQDLSSNSSPLSSLLLNASNSSVGASSSAQSITNVNNQTTVTNQNTGKLNNEIDASVTSGENKANYNTGTGSVVSGDANSSVNVINFLNSNITSSNWMLKTLNVFGNWKGDLTLPAMPTSDLVATTSPSDSGATNSGTGSASGNSANSSTNNSTTLTNNNKAMIENNVTIKTDSGNNDASYNGGSGIVKIGTANAETNQMNVANTNVTGSSWWLVVVNRFGTWNGTAVGSQEAVAIKSTGISTVLTPLQSGVNVTNSPTGAESNSSAGANIDDKTDISNTNQADITNTLNVSAISGENQAKYNSGHGYVETGNINGVNNIINFANTNITVGNWVVVVVNVFGDWNGNLIFAPTGGSNLPVGGSLSCPVFNSNTTIGSSNNATGSGSQNGSSSTTSNDLSSTNNNNANLNNTTSASSSTGQNSANYNTGTGSVSTGGATTGSSVSNTANTNTTDTGQSSGSGSQSGGTDTTGSDSTNNSGTANSTGTSSTNNNNNTTNNNISGSTSTGQNSSNYNTGDGTVDTSWANTFLTQRNAVNDNQVTLGDLTSDFNQTPVAPGSEALLPNDNSTPQTCPGVTIVVTPTTASVATGGTQSFTAAANDPSGNAINPQPTFTWTATGGTIDANGNYTAGNTAGNFAVTATASYGNQGSANVTVTDPPSLSGGGGSGESTSSVGGGGGGGSGGGGGVSLSAPSHKGDFNNDGKVDDLDFSILMASWGEPRTGLMAAELGIGTVGDPDFSIVMSNWTSTLAIN